MEQPHKECVSGVQLTADGRLFSCSFDGLLICWSPERKELWRRTFPGQRCGAMTYSAVGDALAVLISQVREKAEATLPLKSCRLFDAETGKDIRTLPVEDPCSVVFSPDGKQLAFGMRRDGGVRILNVDGTDADAWKVEKPKLDSPDCLRWSPDGRYMLVADYDATLLWDLQTQKLIAKAGGTGDRSAVFSPDSKTVYFACESGKQVQAWDVTSGKKRPMQFSVGLSRINALGLSPDGRVLAVGLYVFASPKNFYPVRCFDTSTGKVIAEQPQHTESIRVLDCNATTIVTGGWDHTIQFYAWPAVEAQPNSPAVPPNADAFFESLAATGWTKGFTPVQESQLRECIAAAVSRGEDPASGIPHVYTPVEGTEEPGAYETFLDSLRALSDLNIKNININIDFDGEARTVAVSFEVAAKKYAATLKYGWFDHAILKLCNKALIDAEITPRFVEADEYHIFFTNRGACTKAKKAKLLKL